MRYDYNFTDKGEVELVDLYLNADSNGYSLSAKYRVEDDHSIREVDIPKIGLRILPNWLKLRYDDWATDRYPYPGAELDLGFGYCRLLPVDRNGHEVYFTETVIEEKTHEMTLDEIEKKLGYKVKIVNKEEA